MKHKKALIITAVVVAAVIMAAAIIAFAFGNYFDNTSVGIIGGADGPTSIIVGSDNSADNEKENIYSFSATVLEASDKQLLIEPSVDSLEYKSCSKIYIPLTDGTEDISVGDKITVVYDGLIQETYPAQISNVYEIIIE